ncbi:MAG: hypothetical protein K8S99_06325 [Planctomycetes bacterium]|nr:hypothetical protein [Planctomycetota bacterium]
MFCKKCHYGLRGLVRDACPECGEAFDRDDPRTFLSSLKVDWRRSWKSALVGSIFILILYFIILVGSRNGYVLMGMLIVGLGLPIIPMFMFFAGIFGLAAHRILPGRGMQIVARIFSCVLLLSSLCITFYITLPEFDGVSILSSIPFVVALSYEMKYR